MKRVIYLLLMVLCLFPISVYALGGVTVSPSSISLNPGTSKTFTITANNAAGRIDISSTNPAVASVSESSIFLDMQSKVITVTANAVGSATIKIYLFDVSTYDDADLAGTTYYISVNVSQPVINNNKPAYNPPAVVDNRSTNTNLSAIKVDGYDLVKVDNNNYTLQVSNNISSININATAEDSKTKVSGNGLHELQIGENNIEIILTAESGATNKIIVKVTRKDGYYIEDLDSVLNDNSIKDIDIVLKADSKITTSELAKIKDSKKLVRLNYCDNNKRVIYSWVIDGSKIKDTNALLTTIEFTTEHNNTISKLSNYAEGMNINFKHSGKIPEGTMIKLFVGNKYKDGDTLNIYYYNTDKNQLELVQKGLKVKDDYVEFNIDHCSEYFITMSTIGAVATAPKTGLNLFMLLFIIESIGVGLYILSYQKEKRAVLKEAQIMASIPKEVEKPNSSEPAANQEPVTQEVVQQPVVVTTESVTTDVQEQPTQSVTTDSNNNN